MAASSSRLHSTAGFARMIERTGAGRGCSKLIRVCYGMLAAMRSPTKVTTRRALQAYLGHKNIQHTSVVASR